MFRSGFTKNGSLSRPSIATWARHFRLSIRRGFKPFRAFLPFPRSVHRIAHARKIQTLRRAVKKHDASWENSLVLVIVGIPKSASSTLVHHFEGALGDVAQGGGFLYARDTDSLTTAVSDRLKPRVVHVGHQSPMVLVRAGLLSLERLNSMRSIAVDRPEAERFTSACAYLLARRYFPQGFKEKHVVQILRLVGRPNPTDHEMSLVYGPEVHLADSSYWLNPPDWSGPSVRIPISLLEDGVRDALGELGVAHQIAQGLVINAKNLGDLSGGQ